MKVTVLVMKRKIIMKFLHVNSQDRESSESCRRESSGKSDDV